MNIVGAGDRFMVYGEDVKTYKVLPADTYKIQFNKMTGFYLISHNDLTVDEKVYGPYARKVQKVMNTFKHLDRNLTKIMGLIHRKIYFHFLMVLIMVRNFML